MSGAFVVGGEAGAEFGDFCLEGEEGLPEEFAVLLIAMTGCGRQFATVGGISRREEVDEVFA